MIKNYLVNNAHRYASKWLVLAIDVFLISVAFVMSYFIRFNLTFEFDIEKLILQFPVVTVIALVSFLVIGSYKGVVRHTGVRDVYNIFNAICLSSIFTIFMVILNRQFNMLEDFTIPLSIIIIHSLIGFILLVASRYVFKTSYDNLVKKFKITKNVLIFGAGESGILTYNALTTSTNSKARVLGYIDEDSKKIGKSINGITVYGPADLTEHFLTKRDISEIIFSIHNISNSKLRELVQSLVDLPVQVKIVPPVEDWINGELNVSQIKQVQIEDLLNRVPIDIKKSKVSNELREQVILVTGGAGSIGSEIARQIAHYEYKSLIIIDQAESALYD
ncbi:MAG: polysaccharide biosynthesis protein, partial [Flavobacteriales bacterium]